MFNSIRWRIAIPYVVLILLLMVGLSIYFSNVVRQIYLGNLKNQLLIQTRLAANEFNKEFASGPSSLDAQASDWSKMTNARVTFVASDGTVIGESHDDRTRMDNHINRPEIIQARETGSGTSIRFSHTEGYDMLYAAVPVQSSAGPIGYVRMALPLQEIQANYSNCI